MTAAGRAAPDGPAAPAEAGNEAGNEFPAPTVSVIICAYTEERFSDIAAAVGSIRAQDRPAAEVILVIDHNDALLRRARAAFPGSTVVPNEQPRGLSGARNTGVERATSDIVAFIDDDARAAPDWLSKLTAPYADPNVVGVGGTVTADWVTGRPDWFPPEFDWVVGCSYVGLPTTVSEIRNPIGAAMSFRRRVYPLVGGFSDGIGRVGALPLGCEETEFYIRLRRALPGCSVLHVPGAVVHHRVPGARARWTYFQRRCFAEGISKAIVTDSVGATAALEAERAYVRRTLPRAVARSLRAREDWPRAGAVVAGVAVTAAGYGRGLVALRTGGVARPNGSPGAARTAAGPRATLAAGVPHQLRKRSAPGRPSAR
ncbi:glycosyltransferase family 2 protein [Frankia sp. CNm7]|uniref:Glycosyltransferase family 2 protein n=1 Tax=Frankia nepalensis TaxID=1836974 RepID=A0A937UNM5_9ACTN|nr:glycosyltransferase family 2 protein [Frankia nepalensis]MBL7501409.1 glycosyltransferase family 2 protein [Frankia nepalensis]MBL7511936.1 glycosyltransferase family 2 protein [Frankia nepalensis]MBL7523423.1 glycosyltransferase family 2 protein [Frankia nepalensis]MBL7628243.1 glycosyltransferase family 2 protein [Frankia nepalensis]